jgi:ribosome-binding protein aMBF1 (putative translation factor)
MASGNRSKATSDSTEFASNVGERVRLERQQKGWTQVQLADAAQLSSNFVARLERGEVGASFFIASRLADALGITLNRLARATPEAATGRTKRGIG